MTAISRYWTSGSCLAALLISGCAASTAYEMPGRAQVITEQSDFIGEMGAVADLTPGNALSWWLPLGGTELDGLVSTLTAESLSLGAARARITQAEMIARQAGGARLPSVTGAGELTGREQIDPDAGDFESLYALNISVQWDTDIFGGLRASERAARLRRDAAILSENALRQSLIAELVRTYVAAYTLRERIAVTEALAESFDQTADLTNERYRAGSASASALDVQIARQNAASSRADLPGLRSQYDIQLQIIDTLLGQPIGRTELTFEIAPDPDLPAFAAGAPIDILGNRPDVALLEANLRAAFEDVGVARARLYPTLSLSAALIQQETELGIDTLAANLVGQLVGPIYEGGRRRNEVRRALAVIDEVSADYSASVLNAVADVERALSLEAASLEEIQLRQLSLDAAQVSDQLATERYGNGQVTLLTVLETRRALENARQALLLANQSRLNARIDLHLALGGTWQDDTNDEDQS